MLRSIWSLLRASSPPPNNCSLLSRVTDRERERERERGREGERAKPYLEAREKERKRCLRFLSRIMHMHYVTFHSQVERKRTGQLRVRECMRHTPIQRKKTGVAKGVEQMTNGKIFYLSDSRSFTC